MNPTIEVQTVELQRKTSLDLVKPKVLQPPTGNHGLPQKCAVCNGKGLIDSFYKHALLMHDDQRNTAYSCCSSPALCCWMSCIFPFECCPCCCCDNGWCCCFNDRHLRECMHGQLCPGKRALCPACFGEGWVRFDGNAKADGKGLLALGRVKFYVMCPANRMHLACNQCRESIPFGREVELFHRAPNYDLCVRCAESGLARDERATCTRISVYARFRENAQLRDHLRLFHELALPNIDGFTYETDVVHAPRALEFTPQHTLPNGASRNHVGYQMRVGSFREEDFAAAGIEWQPPVVGLSPPPPPPPPPAMERT